MDDATYITERIFAAANTVKEVAGDIGGTMLTILRKIHRRAFKPVVLHETEIWGDQ